MNHSQVNSTTLLNRENLSQVHNFALVCPGALKFRKKSTTCYGVVLDFLRKHKPRISGKIRHAPLKRQLATASILMSDTIESESSDVEFLDFVLEPPISRDANNKSKEANK